MGVTYEPFDWYDDGLYYDIIFDAETDTDVAFLEGVFDRYVETGGSQMLEPACGSGRLVAAMSQRGFTVTGFDISAGMLDFARSRLRESKVRARLANARMESFAFREKFDMAHCLVSTFKYLDTEKAARGHLECVARALKPGGVYVLGLHLTDYSDRARNRERWVATRKDMTVTCNIQGWPADRRKRTEKVRSRLIVQHKGATRRLETYWTFRTYDYAQLTKLLRSVPELEHVGTFDFTHNIRQPILFDGAQLDNVLILQRR